MKRFLRIVMSIAFVSFVACENELEDVYDELNIDNTVVGVETYTFTSEDYAEYEDELNGEEFFETQDQADLIIPDFLSNRYPVWGEGSLVNVTYNLYAETMLETRSANENISNLNGIDNYLSSNYETAPNGTFVELTYNSTILSSTLSGGDIEDIAILLATKYPNAAQSASRFGNFERRSSNSAYWSDTMILEGLYAYLGSEYTTGNVIAITFPIYDGGTNFSETFVVLDDGYKFLKLDVDASGSNATSYTLTSGDYDDIETALAGTYPGPAANAGRFSSFDVRPTSGNYWSDAMLLEAFNVVLPVANEGDIYNVTYAIFDGSVSTVTKTLVYQSGTYVESQITPTVEVSPVVAKNEGDWVFPYTFTRSDFDKFEFRFPNFSSSNLYILDIYLEELFPYAQAGDVVMVQYDYFSGGVSTKYGHSVFDGDNWHLTPDVIETSFQYGYEDGEWVPDNTIVYTLLSADIDLIESTFIDVYPGPADNVGFFGSFDRRPGSSNYWSDDMLLEAFNVVLDTRNPNAEEGQKYALTFLTYIGSTVPETKLVIKTNGEWVYQE